MAWQGCALQSLDAFGDAFRAGLHGKRLRLNPTGRGSVRLRSRHRGDALIIAPNYLRTEEDRKVAAESIRQIRTIVGQSALAAYQPVEWKPGVEF